jgi:hypothetical protein
LEFDENGIVDRKSSVSAVLICLGLHPLPGIVEIALQKLLHRLPLGKPIRYRSIVAGGSRLDAPVMWLIAIESHKWGSFQSRMGRCVVPELR